MSSPALETSAREQLGIGLLLTTFESANAHVERLETEFRSLESKSIGLATLVSVVAGMGAWVLALWHDEPSIPERAMLIGSFSLSGLSAFFCYRAIKSVTMVSPPSPIELSAVSYELAEDLFAREMQFLEASCGINDLLKLYERSANELTKFCNARSKWLKRQELSTSLALLTLCLALLVRAMQ